LISSIPLLQEDLPPVYVSVESKEEYFAALKTADDTGDIDDLAHFLQVETFRAIESLLAYQPPAVSSPPAIRTRPVKSWVKRATEHQWQQNANCGRSS
jgi:hypothetical protein